MIFQKIKKCLIKYIKYIKYIKKIKSILFYMALDLSENNILYLLRIGLVAVLLNIALSMVSSMLPLTKNGSFPFSVYDDMIGMLRHNKESDYQVVY